MNYIVVATINAQGVTDTPTTTLANVRDALPGVGLAGLQEVGNLTHRWSLRNHLASRALGVIQDTSTKARAGVALVYAKSRVRLLRRHPLQVGTHPDGAKMLTRYILAVDACIDRTLFVTVIDAHRPPWRYRHLWPIFDAQVNRIVESARYPVIYLTDNNSPYLAPVLRDDLTAYGRGIDLIALGKGLHTTRRNGRRTGAFLLPATRSDHRPVAIELQIP